MKIGDGYFGEPSEKLIGKFDDEIAPLCGLFLMICLVNDKESHSYFEKEI
jgi:hypothetical protein